MTITREILRVKLKGQAKRLAMALLVTGANRRMGGNLKAAWARVKEALALSEALGDVRLQTSCEAHLASDQIEPGRAFEQNLRCLRTSAFPHFQHITGTGVCLTPPRGGYNPLGLI